MTAISFSTAAPAPRLRLTQRGRMVFGTLAALAVVAFGILIGPNVLGAQASSESVTTEFTYVSVEPGQSLWQVAAAAAPQADTREVVADIMRFNALDSADVQPGQELAIPSQYLEH